MDAHFLENVNKIHLIFQLIYKKHAPWTANFQFLAKSLIHRVYRPALSSLEFPFPAVNS